MRNLKLFKKSGGNKLEEISQEDAESGVRNGSLVRLHKGLYKATAMTGTDAEANLQDDDSDPQVYGTKDMVAEPGKRKRGKHRKGQYYSNAAGR